MTAGAATPANAPRLATAPRLGGPSPDDPPDASPAALQRERDGAEPAASAARPVRVLVADPHDITRAGLHIALGQRGFAVCATAADASETLARAATERPDVCVLDVGLPGGAAAAAAALSLQPHPSRVVVLAAGDDPTDFFTALRAGVHGYVLRHAGEEAVAQCVSAVARGQAYIGPTFLTRLVDEFRAGRRRAAGELSPREGEVLRLLGEGLTTKEVARRLSLSPTTVRRHVSSGLHKLGLADRKSALALLRVQQRGERQ